MLSLATFFRLLPSVGGKRGLLVQIPEGHLERKGAIRGVAGDLLFGFYEQRIAYGDQPAADPEFPLDKIVGKGSEVGGDIFKGVRVVILGSHRLSL
jgi:hypothetical protein